ncbi:MAG TPA: hypothetical protein VNL14_23785 [Candidatus Acidoferrales bacterium]|nr:hypothetical protein [Candidatus Acidoferrales bacterium]
MARTWSLLFGLAGILGTAAAVYRLQARESEWEPRHYWFLGLGALFPAWLVGFLGLLQPATAQPVESPLPPPALFSSGGGLIGIIATDYLLRRFTPSSPRRRAVVGWLCGCLGLLPAWIIVLLNL